jgi:hypothetical protein
MFGSRSSPWISDEVLMQQLDQELIRLLRTMAADNRSVPDMVRAIRSRPDGSPALNAFNVLHYFREAFGLTLPQAKPIADWVAYGGSGSDDSELHRLVWPYIEGGRGSWECTAGE